MTAPTLWPRDRFAGAVWSSTLPPSQRLVALAYADHAHDSSEAWVTYDRLQQRTGLSRDSIARHLRALEDGGWLVLLRRRRCGSRVFRLAVPAPEQSDSRTTDDPQQSDGRTPEPSQQSDGRTTGERQQSDGADQQSDGAALAVRPSDSTSVPTSVPTSLSAREDGGAMYDPTTRETTEQPDSFGTRTLAARGSCALTAAQLDALRDKAETRIGIALAAPAVLALLALPNVRNLAAYMQRMPDDDLRALAEHEREQQERKSRPRKAATPSPYRCEHDHPNGLRRSADGGSPCARCDGATPLLAVSS